MILDNTKGGHLARLFLKSFVLFLSFVFKNFCNFFHPIPVPLTSNKRKDISHG